MIRLEDTTGNAVQAAITKERHRLGSPATGMVLTLLVLADEASQADAAAAASFAAQEHPMRILILVPRKGRSAPRLDAEISVGGDGGPGEIAVLRLRGELANHAGSVAIPLLLTDTPVVAWWPHDAPESPGNDPIGIHAQRRITSAANATRSLQALTAAVDGYQPGDTDLSWAQITGWRTLLATALDQPHAKPIGVEVSVQRSSVAGHVLAAWLHSRLKVPANVIYSKGPGITSVRLITNEGEIAITRPDGMVARLTRTGLPPASIALPRRLTGDLLAEELRRLDPDEVYGETLLALSAVGQGRLNLASKDEKPEKAGAAKSSGKSAKATTKEPVGEAPAAPVPGAAQPEAVDKEAVVAAADRSVAETTAEASILKGSSSGKSEPAEGSPGDRAEAVAVKAEAEAATEATKSESKHDDRKSKKAAKKAKKHKDKE